MSTLPPRLRAARRARGAGTGGSLPRGGRRAGGRAGPGGRRGHRGGASCGAARRTRSFRRRPQTGSAAPALAAAAARGRPRAGESAGAPRAARLPPAAGQRRSRRGAGGGGRKRPPRGGRPAPGAATPPRPPRAGPATGTPAAVRFRPSLDDAGGQTAALCAELGLPAARRTRGRAAAASGRLPARSGIPATAARSASQERSE